MTPSRRSALPSWSKSDTIHSPLHISGKQLWRIDKVEPLSKPAVYNLRHPWGPTPELLRCFSQPDPWTLPWTCTTAALTAHPWTLRFGRRRLILHIDNPDCRHGEDSLPAGFCFPVACLWWLATILLPCQAAPDEL